MKNLLVWNQPHALLMSWDTRISDAFIAYSDAMANRINDRPIIIVGTKGSGKTTLLNYMSLQRNMTCCDFDSFKIFNAWRKHHMRDKTLRTLTLGQLVSHGIKGSTDESREDYLALGARINFITDTGDDVSENISYLANMIARDAKDHSHYGVHIGIILMMPSYATYSKNLFTRDFDPTVKRNHIGNPVLTARQLLTYNTSTLSAINRSNSSIIHSMGSGTYVKSDVSNILPLIHNYRTAEWDETFKITRRWASQWQ